LASPLISVIICTYNRANLLRRSLESVCSQSLDRSLYEIIVVDNNSRDQTREVVAQFISRYPAIRYAFEGKQGLSHARNLGWQLSAGRYVAYIDDDSEAPQEWLSLGKEIIEQFEPAAFGGPIQEIPGPTRKRWYKDAYFYQCPITEACFLQPKEYGRIIGMNMFLRHDLIHKIGGFDPRLGMNGETLAYGEETAYLAEIAKLPGEKVYFDTRLYVRDIMRPEKLKCTSALRASFGAGRSSYRRYAKAQPEGREIGVLVSAARTVFLLMADLARACIYRDRKQYPFIQNYIYESTTAPLKELGRLFEQYCHLRDHCKQSERTCKESKREGCLNRG
jgi:glucosyl-dolichyl phosphate glucuronosyltransferase